MHGGLIRVRNLMLSVSMSAFIFGGTLGAHAQTPSPSPSPSGPSLEDLRHAAFVIPTITPQNIQVEETDNEGILRGTFDIVNESDVAVADAGFEIFLNEKTPTPKELNVETFHVFDHKVFPNTYALAPHERRSVAFSYQLPEIPRATYQLRLRIITKSGLSLGWENLDVEVGGATTGFFQVSTGIVKTTGKPIGNSTQGELAEDGAKSPPNGVVQMYYHIDNTGTKTLSGTPQLETYVWDANGERVKTEKDTQQTQTLAGGAGKNLIFQTTAPQKPGAYYAVLSFVNDKGGRISSIGEYRYVVEGPSGHILMARFSNVEKKKVQVTMEVAGPADESKEIGATINATLLNCNNKPLLNSTSYPIYLRAAGSQTVEANFTPPENVECMHVALELKGSDGTVYDQYTLSQGASNKNGTTDTKHMFSFWKNPVFQKTLGFLIVLGISVLAVFATLRALRKQKNTKSTMVMRVLMIGIMGTSMLLSALLGLQKTNEVYAQGQAGQSVWFRQTGATHLIVLYVNKPTNDIADPSKLVDPTNGVLFEFDIKWANSNTRPSNGRMTIDALTVQQKIAPNPATEWVPDENKANMNVVGTDAYKTPATLPQSRWAQVYSQPWDCWGCSNLSANDPYNHMAHASYVGFQPIPDPIKTFSYTTIRYLVYKRECVSFVNCNPSAAPIVDWAGTYAFLNFTPPYAATCVGPNNGINAPSIISPGQPFQASVTVKNTGRLPWIKDATPHELISANAPQDRWTITRVPLPRTPIGRNETVTFSFAATDKSGVIQKNGTSNIVNTQISCTGSPLSPPPPPPTPQCSNGIDDDGDGKIDGKENASDVDFDAECASTLDISEQQEDLNIEETSAISALYPGNYIEYGIRLRNTGAQTLTDTHFQHNIPTGMTFVPGGSQSDCRVISVVGVPMVDCGPYTMVAGDTKPFQLQFQANGSSCNVTASTAASAYGTTVASSTAPFKWQMSEQLGVGPFPAVCGTNINIQPVVIPQCSDGNDNDGDGKTDFNGNGNYALRDPDCSSSQDDSEANAGSIDLRISKTSSQNDVYPLKPGIRAAEDYMNYQVTVTNLSGVPVSDVYFYDDLPENTEFSPGGSHSFCREDTTRNPHRVLCGPLAFSSNGTGIFSDNFPLQFRAKDSACNIGASGSISNTVKLDWPPPFGSGITDPDTGNNSSTAGDITVKCDTPPSPTPTPTPSPTPTPPPHRPGNLFEVLP